MSARPIADKEQIFNHAAEQADAAERAVYLDQACGDDAQLRAEIEELLRHDLDAGSFLDKPAVAFAATRAFADSSGDTVKQLAYSLDFLLPSDQPDSLGTIGAYDVTEVVGRGGMGVVLKGFDPKLNRVVAIKVLAPELASHGSARKRFLREGQAAAAISHEHVVTIHAIDDGGTLPFIVMEYVSGASLQQRIDETGALELTEILRIGNQAADGLAAAHAEGLIHRDIKPANLLLERDTQRVKITDFGLARAVDDVRLTRPGTVTGTPEYMSPEQARSERVDHRSDLFSFGCVLYAMCTGQRPFRAENTVAMIRRVCEDEPASIQEINPKIPDWLARLVEKLLAKNPDDRFQSASEVADLLDQYLVHVQEPAINKSPPDFQPLPQKLKPNPIARRRIWVTATGLLLLVGLAAFAPTIIQMARGDGTLVIEVDDPNVEVLLDGEEIVFKGAGAKDIRIRPGEHEVIAKKDGKRVHRELVTIARHGRQVVKITLEPPAREAQTANRRQQADTKANGGGAAANAPRRLSTYSPMNPRTSAISPDGRSLVFGDRKSKHLVVRDLNTGEDRELVDSRPGQGILISPDGRLVAYIVFDKRDGTAELRTIGIDGSHARVVYDPKEPERWITPLDWSPDGKYIAGLLVRSDDKDGKVAIVMVSVADGSVHTIKSVRHIFSDFYLAFSPDGRYIAFTHEAGFLQTDIHLLPVDGGPVVPVVESPVDDHLMGWAPDGKGLLFRSDRRGEGEDVWLIQISDGRPQGHPVLVRKNLGHSVRPHNVGFTRDGSFYFTTLPFHREVFVATIDPDSHKLLTPPQRVSSREHQRALSPEFSADGKSLAYYVAPTWEQTDEGRRYPAGNIVVRTLATGEEHQIVLSPKFTDGGWWPFLRWAPDGRSILVQGEDPARRWGNYQIDVETGKVSPVVLQDPDVVAAHYDGGTPNFWITSSRDLVEREFIRHGDWSADGKTIFYLRGHPALRGDKQRGVKQTLVARNIQTGEEEVIYRSPEGVVFSPYVSPDGQRVLLAEETALKIMPAAGGEPREVGGFEKDGRNNPTRWRIAWTPDSRYLLLMKGWELWRIAADGGRPERVATLPSDIGLVRDLRVHPDGRQIAFVATSLEWELRVLENFLPELAGPSQLLNPPDANYFVKQFVDSAEEWIEGDVNIGGDWQLDIGQRSPPPGEVQKLSHIGIRFQDVRISQGAKIEKAFVQFTKYDSAREAEPAELTIRAELAGNAMAFADRKHNVSSRKLTKASVTWRPPPWDGQLGQRTEKQRTPDLSLMIQEVLAQKDWQEGNALVLVITGSGERDAYGGGRRYGPMLHVESAPGGEPQPDARGARAGDRLFRANDKNGDGALSKDEVSFMWARRNLGAFDANKDGRIDLGEFQNAWRQRERRGAGSRVEYATDAVYVATVDPDTHKLLTLPRPVSTQQGQRALSPEFSTDGKSLAYYVAPTPERNAEGWQYPPGNIVVLSLANGQERQIILTPNYSDGGDLPRIRLQPDGRTALMRGRSEAGLRGLFQVDMKTGELAPFRSDAEQIDAAYWQQRSIPNRVEGDYETWGEYPADGKAVFYSYRHQNPAAENGQWLTHWRVIRRDLATGKEKEICENPEGRPGRCNFYVSPDGRRLLVGTKNALWICPTAGGEPRELLKLQEPTDVVDSGAGFSEKIRWQLAWTPDSRYLLFLKAGQKGLELWRIEAEAGKAEFIDTLPTKLAGDGIDLFRRTSLMRTYELRVHPDGRQIAFVAPGSLFEHVRSPGPPDGN